mmetsp:Transcript_47022/g.134574  ORF Transcript_47022/g.134574 Transcript_47022/m.134574 type:complete len:561 (+) Transcript_47022:839-2521(+)
MLHDGTRDLAKGYPQRLLLTVLLILVVLVRYRASLAGCRFGRAFLHPLCSALQGLRDKPQADLAEMLHLLCRQDARPTLLQASRDAIHARLEREEIRLGFLRLHLRQGPVEELHDELPHHLGLAVLPRAFAELGPGLIGQIADLLAHGELEDWQQCRGGLSDEGRVGTAKLVHEAQHTLECTLQVLHLRRVHDHDLVLAVLGDDCEVHLLPFVPALLRGVQLPGLEGEFLEDPRQDVRHEGEEVFLEDTADALRSRHHVLLDGVIAGQVRHLRRLDHRLHDDLRVCEESLTAHGLGQEGDALEALAQEGALLDLVQHAVDDRLQVGHQRPVVGREGVAHLPGDDGDEGDGLLLEGGPCLQLHPTFLHEWLQEWLQVVSLHGLTVVLKGLHAAQGHARATVVHAFDELGQQLGSPSVRRDNVRMVLGELSDRAPSGVADPHMGGGELGPDPHNHLLNRRLVVDVFGHHAHGRNAGHNLLPGAALEERGDCRLQRLADPREALRRRGATADAVDALFAEHVKILFLVTLFLVVLAPSFDIFIQRHDKEQTNFQHLLDVVRDL